MTLKRIAIAGVLIIYLLGVLAMVWVVAMMEGKV